MKRVYFIKPIGMDGPIKIGCSWAPDHRREGLETWSPFPLELLATIEGTGQLERQFHALFADDHSHKEWFRVTPELLGVIAAVQAGTFDISSLPAPRIIGRKVGDLTRQPWSTERKQAASRNHAIRKAERASGRVLDWNHSEQELAQFLADPASNGITREERKRRMNARSAAYHRQLADDLLTQ